MPRHRLAVDIDASVRVLRAADLAAYRGAEQAVAAAHAQAQEIIASARAVFEQERARGYREGTDLARAEGAQRIAEQVARTDNYFSEVEERLVTLVMQAVRKIVHGYGERERVVHSVRNALAVVRNQKHLTLRVNPHNVEHVQARTAALLADYPGVSLLDVIADARLGGDCCVLESEIGMVEASTEGQLAALAAAFRQVRAARA